MNQNEPKSTFYTHFAQSAQSVKKCNLAKNHPNYLIFTSPTIFWTGGGLKVGKCVFWPKITSPTYFWRLYSILGSKCQFQPSKTIITPQVKSYIRTHLLYPSAGPFDIIEAITGPKTSGMCPKKTSTGASRRP